MKLTHQVLNVQTARAGLSKLLRGEETVLIGRHGKPNAVLMPFDDYSRMLQHLEDLEDTIQSLGSPPSDLMTYDNVADIADQLGLNLDDVPDDTDLADHLLETDPEFVEIVKDHLVKPVD